MNEDTWVGEGRVVRATPEYVQSENAYFIEAYLDRAINGGRLILCPYGVVSIGDPASLETSPVVKVTFIVWDMELGETRQGGTWVEKSGLELVEDPNIVESVLARSNTLGTTTESGTLRMGGTGQRDNTTESSPMTQAILDMQTQLNRALFGPQYFHETFTDAGPHE